MATYTIGALIKRFELSRSTLLYYDKIGLLTPSARSDAGYRLYTDNDLKRMEQIALYKEAGLALEAIAQLLDEPDSQPTRLLEQHLGQLNREIQQLRAQQQQVLKLLGSDSLLRHSRNMDKQQWVAILSASGMSEEDMCQWHVAFEQNLPEAHQDFLESLSIDPEEINEIRRKSRENWREDWRTEPREPPPEESEE